MSHSPENGAIEFEVESSFCEDVAFNPTLRLPLVGRVDLSGLRQDKLAPELVKQFRQEGFSWHLGPIGGSFRVRIWLTGHGATLVGAGPLTPSAVEEWMGLILGNCLITGSASTTATGGTASVPTTAAADGMAAGGLVRVGARGDGDGNGQMYPVVDHDTNDLTLGVALDGAPVNGAVVSPVVNIFPSEDPTDNDIESFRCRLLTANHRVEVRGCFPMSWQFGVAPSGRGFFEVEVGVAHWQPSTATFPSSVTMPTATPTPLTGGSFFCGPVGDPTRDATTKRQITDFAIEYTAGIEAVRGVGGTFQYQDIITARRVGDMIRVRWTELADAASLTPFLDTLFQSSTRRQIMYTGSAADGSAIGIHLPSCCPVGERPVQREVGRLNAVTIAMEAYTNVDGATELERTAFKLGSA